MYVSSNKSHRNTVIVLSSLIFLITFYVLAESILFDNPYNVINLRRIGYGIGSFLEVPYNFLVNPPYPENSGMRVINLNVNGNLIDKLDINLPESGKKCVRGHMLYGGRLRKVKVRYRGENQWHWRYYKKSLRVKTRKSQLFESARLINIINPRDSTNISTPLGSRLGAMVGLLTPNCEYTKLKLNNKIMGVYYILEHPDESFLRNHKRIPGDIYTWEKTGWKKKAHLDSTNKENTDNFDFLNGLISKFENIESETPDVNKLANKFPSKTAMQSTLKDLAKVMDINKMLTHSALVEISANTHGMEIQNLAIYFDPSKGKFEPVSWDLAPYGLFNPTFPINTLPNEYLKCVLLIPGNADKRNREIYDLIANGVLTEKAVLGVVEDLYNKSRGDVLADIYKDHGTINAIYRDAFLPISLFYTNRDYKRDVDGFRKTIELRFDFLREAFNGCKLKYYISGDMSDYSQGNVRETPIARLVFKSDGENAAKLDSLTIETNVPVENLSLWRDQNRNGKFDANDKLIAKVSSGKKYEFKLGEVFFTGKFPVSGERWPKLKTLSLSYPYFVTAVPKKSARKAPFIKKLSFKAYNFVTNSPIKLETLESAPICSLDKLLHPWDFEEPVKDVLFRRGVNLVSKNMVIEEGSSLTFEPGAVLLFEDGVSIISYGKVVAEGTEREPIIFSSKSKNGKWGALVLQGAGSAKSVFKFCTFERGTSAKNYLEKYSGMVSVYNSSAKFYNCVFRDNFDSDDMFNGKHSKIDVVACNFINSFADAVDLDYCEGSITETLFENSGNDSVDLMTSSPKIYYNFISKSNDKGISVGERSNPVIFNNVFTKCVVSIASKDASAPVILNNVFLENKTGLSGYQKNWRYGSGGHGEVINSLFLNNDKAVLEDRKSKFGFKNTYFSAKNKYASLVIAHVDSAKLIKDDYIIPPSGLYDVGTYRKIISEFIPEYSNGKAPIGLIKAMRVVNAE